MWKWPIPLIFFFFLCIFSADPGELSLEPIPFHSPDSLSGSIIFTNDGLGFDYTGEWDDGRTMGLELCLSPLPWLYTQLSYYAFTGRKDPAKNSSAMRQDEVSVTIGWKGDWSLNNGRIWTAFGAGGFFFGNIGGYEIQKNWHKLIHVFRSIPLSSTYNPSHCVFQFSGESGLTHFYGSPVSVSIGYSFSGLGSWQIKPAISGDLTSPYGLSRFTLEYVFGDPRGLPETVSIAERYESGIWLEAMFTVHSFYIKHSLNTFSHTSQGSVGFLFSNHLTGNEEALFQGLFRVEFAPTLKTQSYLNRISWSPVNWNWNNLRGSLTLDFQSGWLSMQQGKYRRFQYILGGLELAYPLTEKGILEPFAAVSSGPSFVKIYKSNDGSRASIETGNWGGLLRITGGIRLLPFNLKPKDRRLVLGLTTGILMDIDLDFNTKDSMKVSPFIGLSFSDG